MSKQRRTFCDGLRRRSFLRLGGAALFAAPCTLAGVVGSEKKSLASPLAAKAKSLIFVFLKGGLSTIDTWDLKPDAPAEFRGEFRPISSSVAGIQLGEHIPRTAQQMDKFSLIRSFAHGDSNHGPADHYMLTGYRPTAGFNAGLAPNNQRPSHGAIISRSLGPQGAVPPYICLPDMHPSCGASYLGPPAEPFSIDSDPSDPAFKVRDIVPPLDVDAARAIRRKQLLQVVDRYQKSVERAANSSVAAIGEFRQKAFELMTSKEAKKAFNIHDEPDRLRDEYGRDSLGQSCLMARRLVAAGVRCITINHVDWDTHDSNFTTLRRDLLPKLDAAMSTLFRDLDDRGMLESTLVVVSGEFGRTPQINKNAGRDHWGDGFTVAIGGGGIQGGRVIGKTTSRAEKPAVEPHGPEDLAATLHRLLGINPEREFFTPEGRPIKVVNEGRTIQGLL